MTQGVVLVNLGPNEVHRHNDFQGRRLGELMNLVNLVTTPEATARVSSDVRNPLGGG
jgi:hypothetical protein